MRSLVLLLLATSLWAGSTSTTGTAPTKKGKLDFLKGSSGLRAKSDKARKGNESFGFGGPRKSVDTTWIADAKAKAAKGDANAQLKLGRYYGMKANPRQYDLAREYLQPVAKSGNAQALYYLGVLFGRSRASFYQVDSSLHYLKKAARLGEVGALNLLGDMYAQARNVDRDYNKAIEYYTNAYEKSKKAVYLIKVSDCYGKKKMPEKKFQWQLKAAETGYKFAYFSVATAYRKGRGVKKDLKQAAYWYEEGFKTGDCKYAYDLARLYATDVANDTLALIWYKKAYRAGYHDASYWVGNSYKIGKGTEVNLDSASHYFTLASKRASYYSKLAKKEIGRTAQKKDLSDLTSSADSANYYFKLGNSAAQRRDSTTAIFNYQKALKCQINAVGTDDKTVVFLYKKIAFLHGNITSYFPNRVKLEKRVFHLLKAAEIEERLYTKGQLYLPLSYVRIGDVYSKLDQYENARTYYRKALDLYSRDFRPKHINLPELYAKMVRTEIRLRSYKTALVQLDKMLSVELAIHGGQDFNRGFFFDVEPIRVMQKDRKKTIAYCLNALALEEKKLGTTHGRVKSRLKLIGSLYKDDRNMKKAEEYFSKANAI